MMEFDVSGAIARVYDLAEPGSPVFVDGVQLVFALCGWHYLRDYADRYGSTQAARRMLVHVAEAEADFNQWAARMAKKASPSGPASGAVFSGDVADAITKSRKGECAENGAC